MAAAAGGAVYAEGVPAPLQRGVQVAERLGDLATVAYRSDEPVQWRGATGTVQTRPDVLLLGAHPRHRVRDRAGLLTHPLVLPGTTSRLLVVPRR
jgi:hypothetical protein